LGQDLIAVDLPRRALLSLILAEGSDPNADTAKAVNCPSVESSGQAHINDAAMLLNVSLLFFQDFIHVLGYSFIKGGSPIRSFSSNIKAKIECSKPSSLRIHNLHLAFNRGPHAVISTYKATCSSIREKMCT